MAIVDVGPDLALTTLQAGSTAAGVGGTVNVHPWSTGAAYQYTGAGNEALSPSANQIFQVSSAEKAAVSFKCSGSSRGIFDSVAGLVLRRLVYDTTGGSGDTGLVSGLAAISAAVLFEECDFVDTAGAKARPGVRYSGPNFVYRRCLWYGIQEGLYVGATGGGKVFASKFINTEFPVAPHATGKTNTLFDGCSFLYDGNLARLCEAGVIRNCAGENLSPGVGNEGFRSLSSQDYNVTFGFAGSEFVGAGVGGNNQTADPLWTASSAVIAADVILGVGSPCIAGGNAYGDPSDDGLDFDSWVRPNPPAVGAYEGDVVPPAVTITSGTTSADGNYTIEGTATDASGVAALDYEFSTNPGVWIPMVLASPFSEAIGPLPAVTTTITVRATDSFGNTGTDSVTVVVHPPVVTITSPAFTLTGAYTLAGTATGAALASIHYRVDGGGWVALAVASSFAANLTLALDAVYFIEVKVVGGYGQTTTASISVTAPPPGVTGDDPLMASAWALPDFASLSQTFEGLGDFADVFASDLYSYLTEGMRQDDQQGGAIVERLFERMDVHIDEYQQKAWRRLYLRHWRHAPVEMLDRLLWYLGFTPDNLTMRRLVESLEEDQKRILVKIGARFWALRGRRGLFEDTLRYFGYGVRPIVRSPAYLFPRVGVLRIGSEGAPATDLEALTTRRYVGALTSDCRTHEIRIPDYGLLDRDTVEAFAELSRPAAATFEIAYVAFVDTFLDGYLGHWDTGSLTDVTVEGGDSSASPIVELPGMVMPTGSIETMVTPASSAWTCYVVKTTLRWETDAIFRIEFYRASAHDQYRVTFDTASGSVALAETVGGVPNALATETGVDLAVPARRGVTIDVQHFGTGPNQIRVYVDSVLVLEDATSSAHRMGPVRLNSILGPTRVGPIEVFERPLDITTLAP